MSELPEGATKANALWIMVFDFAMYLLIGAGLVLMFTGSTESAQWAFIAALSLNAASNAQMFKILGRRTSMRRHPSGKDLNNGR